MQSPPFPRYLVPPRSKYSPQHHVLKHPQLPFLPQCQQYNSFSSSLCSLLHSPVTSFLLVPNILLNMQHAYTNSHKNIFQIWTCCCTEGKKPAVHTYSTIKWEKITWEANKLHSSYVTFKLQSTWSHLEAGHIYNHSGALGIYWATWKILLQ